MAKPYEVVTLFEPTTSRSSYEAGDGTFYTDRDLANKDGHTRHGSLFMMALERTALRVPGGWYYLLAQSSPVAVHGTWQFKAKLQDHRRKSALAKLTPEEIEALGIKLS